MSIKEILSIIIELHTKKNYVKGIIICQYPEKYLTVIKEYREIIILNNSKCFINEFEYNKSNSEEYVEVIIKINNTKEKVNIKKKFLRINNMISKL